MVLNGRHGTENYQTKMAQSSKEELIESLNMLSVVISKLSKNTLASLIKTSQSVLYNQEVLENDQLSKFPSVMHEIAKIQSNFRRTDSVAGSVQRATI